MKTTACYILISFVVCTLGSAQVPLDPSTATREPKSPQLFYDARQLTIEGKGFSDTPTGFSRLPERVKGQVTPAVWNLGSNGAGLYVRFESDSPNIAATWDTDTTGMAHMARTGSNGLDLYYRRGKEWVYCGTGKPWTIRATAVLAGNRPKEMSEYMLYAPLYSKLKELKIGVDEGSKLLPAKPRPKDELPIVFYGTSITQGGCASRAGMCHTGILGRWLNRETINLGFSGAGKMEPIMAELMTEIPAAAYVLEPLPNMTLALVQERYSKFVDILRSKHPETPIVLVEHPSLSHDAPLNRAVQKIRDELKAKGVRNLFYITAEPQFAGPENPTVDNSHPTDLGFLRMAEAYKPVLLNALKAGPAMRANKH